jgi:2-oxoisovalerate dehydrogenase E1 component
MGETVCVITYGMGVHWAMNAAKSYEGNVEIIDLRTLYPMDEAMVIETIKKHGKCIMLTEEQVTNSFLQAVAGRMSEQCFRYLDAPIKIIGAKDYAAVPLNIDLEKEMLPNADIVMAAIGAMLAE